MTMNPFFADAIDIPLVLGVGVAILIPLMLFEIGVEAFVLRKLWRIPLEDLWSFAFFANCWSLAAGIPTKIFNAFLYGLLLPRDIPGFIAEYPFAVSAGSFVYFAVTVAVEGGYAFRWLRLSQVRLGRKEVWIGVLLANVATYAVLAPLHYYLTRPTHSIQEFTQDPRWSTHAKAMILFTDSKDGFVKAIRLDASASETIVPFAAKDYLVSADLNLCLFRGSDGNLYFYQRQTGRAICVWKTDERFRMDQVAFSPSAERVAIASEETKYVEVVHVQTGQRNRLPFPAPVSSSWDLRLAWSKDEAKVYLALDKKIFSVSALSESDFKIEPVGDANPPILLECYGRVGAAGRWGGGSDWGGSYSQDKCSDFAAWVVPGLGSELRILREDEKKTLLLRFAINLGLLHLARFHFDDVAFLDGCNECVFGANEYLYLLDIQRKRIGTVAHGERFILMSARYAKHL